MTRPGNSEVLQLRAHHIFCLRFLKVGFEERGAAFLEAEKKAKEALMFRPDVLVEAAEGADEVCATCFYCSGGVCGSPKGGEMGVQKWDAIILKELGVAAGSCLTSSEWQKLIQQKAPLRLCQRCQWRGNCDVGG